MNEKSILRVKANDKAIKRMYAKFSKFIRLCLRNIFYDAISFIFWDIASPTSEVLEDPPRS